MDTFFGWAAFLSGAATIGTAVTAVLFFSRGGRFGRLNDAVSVLQLLLMVPVAIGLFLASRDGSVAPALIITLVGVAGMLAGAVMQGLLVFGVVAYETTASAVLAVGALIGVWLVGADLLALTAGALSAGPAAFGIAAGIGYFLLAVGFRRAAESHPLTYVGAGLSVLGYSVWSVWVGWLFTSGQLSSALPG